MLTYRGFSAWIVSNAGPVNEHLITMDEDTHQISCWIPGDEGQTFTVYWKDNGTGVDSCAFIYLDGFLVPGRFLFGGGMTSRQGIRTGLTSERPFVFGKIDELMLQGTSSQAGHKDSGMIILRIKQVVRCGSTFANTIQRIPNLNVGSRRSGDLYIGFGPDQKEYDQSPVTWRVKAYKEDESQPDQPVTHVSFAFRYRSRDFLLSQGIATLAQMSIISFPQIPSRASSAPPPESVDDSSEELDPSPKRKKKERLGPKKNPSKGKKKATEARRVITMPSNPVFSEEQIMQLYPVISTHLGVGGSLNHGNQIER